MSWDRVERLLGAEALRLLGQMRVAVIGLGSGGGFVATSLAMCGVGRFVLVDDETLDAANIVRHVADRRDLGRPKVDAVADLIRERNPQAEIVVVRGRIENHREELTGVELVVCAVDGEGAKFLINERECDSEIFG